MSNTKSTKRALLSSVMAMLICVAMLIGTTFAWFTDSVTSSGNKIQSGTLNIDLLVKKDVSTASDSVDMQYVSVKNDHTAIFDYDKWEPGYTEVRNVKVSTTGNLALKYTLKIVPQSATADAFKLAEVIDVYYANSEVTVTDRNDLTDLTRIGSLKDFFTAGTVINDTLIPDQGNTEDYATIVLKMQESANNDYQGLSVGNGFDLHVLAAQYTYEEDSFNNQYDAQAEYAVYDVTNNESLNAAIAQGGIITLPVLDNQVTLGNNQAIGGDTVIDMSGSSQPIQASIKVKDGKSLTMSNGTLVKNDNLGSIRFDNKKGLDSEGETQAGIFNDMTFKNTKGSVTDMVQIVPRGDSTGKYIFRNCHFIDANVAINGCSGDEYGDNGQVEIVFENCTFDINGWPAINFSSNYCTGSMTVKDCTFNMTTPAGSFSAAINADGSKPLSLTFAGTNYINNNGANPNFWAYVPTGATVIGTDTIVTTGTVKYP